MRQTLLASGKLFTCVPHSLLPFVRHENSFHVLPIELPPWETATMILKLRGRAMPPMAEAFFETVRGLAGPLRIGSAR